MAPRLSDAAPRIKVLFPNFDAAALSSAGLLARLPGPAGTVGRAGAGAPRT